MFDDDVDDGDDDDDDDADDVLYRSVLHNILLDKHIQVEHTERKEIIGFAKEICRRFFSFYTCGTQYGIGCGTGTGTGTGTPTCSRTRNG